MDGSQILIFMDTKKGCDQITRQLRMDGWPALSIHGDKSQAERDWVLSEFKSGKSPIMTATDVAARGLDVKDVKYVINYDFPGSLEDYVHQIGRTGRAGAKGTAYTSFTAANARFAKELITILKEAGQKVSPELAAMGRGAPHQQVMGVFLIVEGVTPECPPPPEPLVPQPKCPPCVRVNTEVEVYNDKVLHSSGKIFISRNVEFNELEFPFQQLFGTDQHKSPLSGTNSSLDVTTLFDLFANPSDSSSSQRITQPILQEVSQNVAGSSNSGDNIPSLLNHDLGSPHLSSDFPVSQPAEPIEAAPPTTLHPMVTRSRNGIFKPRVFLSNCSLPSSFLTETEPKNVKTAMADPKWLDAMDAEFKALQLNKTWTLVPKLKFTMISSNLHSGGVVAGTCYPPCVEFSPSTVVLYFPDYNKILPPSGFVTSNSVRLSVESVVFFISLFFALHCCF
ncbi:hypothetical protein EZV62_003125 [Acer yangbiense]|uniref:RNA helicase n=1 Tax=Acer yangbiense TaxID=1000413 RepID=A0A5C7IFV8_9ROSI|nr:hypothetical protein EZV62_003125 [Acer yangbiense]